MPSPLSVIESLRKTEKGRLKYYNEWTAKDLASDIASPKIRRSTEGIVFEVSSIRAALEAIDDDANVHAENAIDEEKTKSRLEMSRKEKDLDEGFRDFIDVDAPLRQYEAELEEQKRRENIEQIKKQEEFYAEIERKTQERVRNRRKEELQRKSREEERMKRFFQEAEESALRIRREMQAHQDHIIKTRQQEMEERKLRLQLLQMKKQKEDFEKLANHMRGIQNVQKDCLERIRELPQNIVAEIGNSRIPIFVGNLNEIYNRSNSVFTEAKNRGKTDENEIVRLKSDSEMMTNIRKNILSEIDLVGLRVKELEIRAEKEKQELILRQKREAAQAEKLAAESAKAKAAASAAAQAPTQSLTELHKNLKSKMTEYESEGRKLTKSSDRSMKQLAMGLSRAVSVPISSITDRSGSDLKSRLKILVNVIKTNPVTSGTQTVSTKGNPAAQKFAINLIARKIVSQANEQVSANFTSAFSIAFMVIGIWAESSDFGDLFLAHLQSKCIYSVPMYLLKQDSQTEEEHQKLLGYIVSEDGAVEQQDKYLRRMSGLVRLYAAVIQSPLPPGVSVHPHGLAKGWAWLAEMLNMEPQPDVSATVLYDFLEVAGHALMKTYKMQFEKLLYVLCHDYFPKLEEITGVGHRAPLIRLKNFLEKCIKEKSVPMPKGRLDKGFWNTYHSGEVVGE
uniref:nucleoporin GLE1-like n=1 Tax=Styela clava TaxID=7725 RepID=UPI00193A9925|nr:nucleoporin GLE1-like [Styela clava]